MLDKRYSKGMALFSFLSLRSNRPLAETGTNRLPFPHSLSLSSTTTDQLSVHGVCRPMFFYGFLFTRCNSIKVELISAR